MNIIYKVCALGILTLSMLSCTKDGLIEKPLLDKGSGINSGGEFVKNPNWEWLTVYPGTVHQDVPRLKNIEVTISGTYSTSHASELRNYPEYWQSSGLYAPPAEKIVITIPAGVSNLKYLIGVQTGMLNNLPYKRYPGDISRRGDLREGVNEIFSADSSDFGGNIYFYFDGNPSVDQVIVKVDGAVRSLDYIMGQTDAATWKKEVATSGMIWGELRSPKIVLTLPVSALKMIDDPEALIGFYDAMIRKGYEELNGYNDDAEQESMRGPDMPWRLFPDLQLWDNSQWRNAYPIAIQDDDIGKIIVELPQFNSARDFDIFKAFSEPFKNDKIWLGERFLRESLINLYQYYTASMMNKWPYNRPRFEGYVMGFAEKEEPSKRFTDMNLEGRLTPFIQLAQKYGWPIISYISKQSKIAGMPENPLTQVDLIDNNYWGWHTANNPALYDDMAMFATEYANQNLLPFFSAWGFHLSPWAEEYMNGYPALESNFWVNFDPNPAGFNKLTPVVHAKSPRAKHSFADRSNWKATASSETWRDDWGRGAAMMLDNDLWSTWVTEYDDNRAVYPHTLIFDFNNTISFNYIMAAQRWDAWWEERVRRLQFYVKESADGDWKPIDNSKVFYLGSGYGDGHKKEGQLIYLSKTYEGVAIKAVLLSPHPRQEQGYSDIAGQNSGRTAISEFGVGMFK